MTLCTPLTPMLNEKCSQYYHCPSIYDLGHMYQKTLETYFNIDLTNPFQLAQRLARSLSVEGILPMPINNSKAYLRAKSLYIHQNDDICFTSIESESDFQAVIEDEEDHKRHYSTKTPYQSPSEEYSLSSPPNGYKPVGVQLLARHGSRSLNGHDYDIQLLQIWQIAKQKNLLTKIGEQLKEDIELFIEENNLVGRGELTQLGKQEQFGIGTRLYKRLQTLFNSSNKISVVTSGKKRAVDSSEEFINGLKTTECNIEVSRQNPNKSLLYFHKSCSDYMTFKKTNADVKSKLNLIKSLEQTKTYAQQVLRRIFRNEFVNFLVNGNHQFNEKKSNEVDIVLCLYKMFVVAPAQNHQKLAKMLAKYFNQQESNWFAYVSDAEEFYVKGPSIEGTTITYDMAKPLLADFFSSINTCLEKSENITAHLRFAHAETVIPFATLLQIPDFTDKAVHMEDLYTYENNQWRGDRIAPMAANIQWEIYQHENDSNQVLVRMLYNEMEVRFNQECQSLTPNSYFYDLNELKRVYANILSSSSSS